jgi:RNA polymerase sigma factor (sigma-70 family)
MGRHDPDTTAEELLAHSGWLRALAIRLVGDADVAEDLVQETWIAAARRTPEARESLRPWLAKVLRDAFRMRARSEGRRSAREQTATLAGTVEADEVPTPESLVARAEAQRRMVDLVLRLEEPYRSTLLLHYSEGVSLADIARAQGVPAGTVRWRMKAAIDQLRAWLDETGERKQWVVMLLALPKGALVAQKTSKVALAIVLLLLLAGGAAIFLALRGKDDRSSSRTAEGAGGASAATGAAGADGTGAYGGTNAGVTDGVPPPPWLVQRGVKPRRIAGHVVGLDGKPIGNAAVELGSLVSSGGLGSAPRVTTDAAGAFDFGPRPAMAYAVTASAPGTTGATHNLDLRNPVMAPPPDKLELRLGPCDHAVFGTVRDASGGAVEGARIQWLTSGPTGNRSDNALARSSSALSSATGAYELCVAGGREQVITEVTADGYGAVVYQTQVWGRRKVDFALVPEAIVVGRVIREDSREPVARAAVALSSAQWGVERTAARAAFTGSDGTFRITGVAPGPHVIDAIADGLSAARETPIVVEAGQTTEPIEIVLETRSTVRGTVVDDGQPVAGAVITAHTADSRRGSGDAVSQLDGSFTLDRVPRGTVRFVARPHEVTSPRTFAVSKPAHDDVIIEVKPLGVIAGSVTRKGQTVAGALVELNGPNSHELGPVRTGSDGRFEARGLKPGRWVVFAGSDREGAFGRAKEDVELAAGETREVTIDMPYGAAISGTVVDQDGAPVPTVSVVFQHTGVDDVGIATTSTDGRFRAAMMVGGGTYRPTVRFGVRTLSVLRPAEGSDFPLVTLADGATELTGVVLAVRLDHLAIAGRVVDENGAPVPDARVAAERTEAGVEPHFWRWYQQTATMTDVDGRFTIEDLSSGPHALQVRTGTGLETIVQGIAAGRKDVTVVLASAGSIEGTLAGFAGTPRVFAMRQDSRASDAPLRGTVTGASFVVPSLSPGNYVVSAYTDTEVASARVTVTAGAAARVDLTGGGSGSIAGRLRDFKTGAPVEGARCNVFARSGETRTSGAIGTGDESDRSGAFELPAVAAGELAVACWTAGSTYTDGLRLVTVAPSQRLEIDVPVVAIRQDPTLTIGGVGADFDRQSLTPRLFRVAPRGPAGAAGLADGDVITAVDGASVTELSPRSVWFLLIYHPPGTTVPVTARRGARSFTVNLVIGPTDE